MSLDERWFFALRFVAALGCGLVAGVFFAFSSFVMGALSRIAPAQGIAAMQAINVRAVTPAFMGLFMGTALACLATAICSAGRVSQPGVVLGLIGCALYLVGTFGVTIAGNVPLNDALASLDPSGSGSAQLWNDYVARWTAWNHVRTVAALIAAAALVLALCQRAP